MRRSVNTLLKKKSRPKIQSNPSHTHDDLDCEIDGVPNLLLTQCLIYYY
jgi:hypothetical protein